MYVMYLIGSRLSICPHLPTPRHVLAKSTVEDNTCVWPKSAGILTQPAKKWIDVKEFHNRKHRLWFLMRFMSNYGTYMIIYGSKAVYLGNMVV